MQEIRFLLHAHLPFVHHPEHEVFDEENWFFEAMVETYLPLLALGEKRVHEGKSFPITLSLSLPLISMMDSPLLRKRLILYIRQRVALVREWQKRYRHQPLVLEALSAHLNLYEQAEIQFHKANQDVAGAFIALSQSSGMALITAVSSHPFLPLIKSYPGLLKAHFRFTRKLFKQRSGLSPREIWLPECGWAPELAEPLLQNGYSTVFLEHQSIPHPHARHPNGLQFLTRSPTASERVWDAQSGYPGNPQYREFHHDLVSEMEPGERMQFLGYASPLPSGIKLKAVGERGIEKKPLYSPSRALNAARHDAIDFLQCCKESGEGKMLCPYDAELFGHWWREGVDWLEGVLQELDQSTDQKAVTAFTDTLPAIPDLPPEGSWGHGGFSQVWVHPQTAWMHPYLHNIAQQMENWIQEPSPLVQKPSPGWTQICRSAFLAQSSDWLFLQSQHQQGDFPANSFLDASAAFHHLAKAYQTGKAFPPKSLAVLQYLDALFPWADFSCFQIPRDPS